MRNAEATVSRSSVTRNSPPRSLSASLVATAGLVLASAGAMYAQPALSQVQQSETSHAMPAQPAPTSHTIPPSATPNAAPPQPAPSGQAPAGSAAPSPNLLEQPAEPATVENRGGSLSVRANNASLAQILHQVARETGMQLDGLSGDERVFGTFGPGNPRDVLVSLLNGTSYNVMMVGDLANGAPRQLLLTPKTGSALASAGNGPQAQPKPSDNPDESEDAPPDQDAPQPQPDQSQDLQNQQPEEPPPGSTDSPRTPQQMLEQLQQMHQSEQPPEQPPEPPPQ